MELSKRHLDGLFGGNIPTAQVLQGVAAGLADCGVTVVIDPNTTVPKADTFNKRIILPAHVIGEKALLIVSWHVDHESGHIIYTPPLDSMLRKWETNSKILDVCKAKGYKTVPEMFIRAAKLFWNYCEDPRIEHLMLRRFPGSKKHFIGGPIAAGLDNMVEDYLAKAAEVAKERGVPIEKAISPFWAGQLHAYSMLDGFHGQKPRNYVEKHMPPGVQWVLDIVNDELGSITRVQNCSFDDLVDSTDTIVSKILEKVLPDYQPPPPAPPQQGEGDGDPDQGKPNENQDAGAFQSEFEQDQRQQQGQPQPQQEQDNNGDSDGDEQEGGSDADEDAQGGSGGDEDQDGAEGEGSSGGDDEGDDDEDEKGSEGSSGSGDAEGDSDETDGDEADEDTGSPGGGDGDTGSGSGKSSDSDADGSDSDGAESGDEDEGESDSGDSSGDDEGSSEGSEGDEGDDEGSDSGSDDSSEGVDDTKPGNDTDDCPYEEENGEAKVPQMLQEWIEDAGTDIGEMIRCGADDSESGADGGAGSDADRDTNLSGSPYGMKHAKDMQGMPDEYFRRIRPGVRDIVIAGQDLTKIMGAGGETFQQYDNDIRGLMPKDLGPAARAFVGRFKSAPGQSYVGSRVNPRMLQPILAGKAAGRKLFVKRMEPTQSRKGVCVMVAVDCSGSMCSGVPGLQTSQRSKFAVSHAAARSLARLLQNLNIPFSMVGFTATNSASCGIGDSNGYNASRKVDIVNFLFKDFDEPWTSSEQQMLAMNPGTRTTYKGKSIRPHTNSDGESLIWAATRILPREEDNKVMIVISDGLPYGGDQQMQSKFLKWAVYRILKAGINIGGLGLGCDAVKNYYPFHEIIKEFPEGQGTDITAPLFIQEKLIGLIDAMTEGGRT